jgi:hypothetical protein
LDRDHFDIGGDVAVAAEELNVGVDVVLGGNRVEDEMRISIRTSCSVGSRRAIVVPASGDVSSVAE